MKLSSLFSFLEAYVKALIGQLAKLKDDIRALKEENTKLKEQLKIYQNPKNSSNSSIPPSKDENCPKPNQSLRKSTGKKPGGQKGHKGTTLKASKAPDKIIELKHEFCINCGLSLSAIAAIKQQVRQIVDIPPIKVNYTEYQSFSRPCSCGCQNRAKFPHWVKAAVSYGPNIESLTGYLHSRQYLPFKRMQELLNQVFKIDISEGGIHCLLNRFAEKTTPIYELIQQKVAQSKVVGSDETGAKVNGKNHYFWAWQTEKYNYLCHSDNRAYRTVRQHFPKGFPHGILVHDGWKPQFKTKAKAHQNCFPHLFRRLNYLNGLYPNNKWGNQFIQLLYDALEVKVEMKPSDYCHHPPRNKILKRFEDLANAPPDKNDKELYSFYKRMLKERNTLFTFLFFKEVPADNNASERAVRNLKVKQKISGQFKTEKAAQNFAKLRSVVDTVIKNETDVWNTLRLIAMADVLISTD